MTTTATDIHLAHILYDILLDHARAEPGKAIRYKQVLEIARKKHPSDMMVAGAVPVSMGRRLDVIVKFVRTHELPPLTCIVVNESGRPGDSYRTLFGSWENDMDAVAAYDWSAWKERWNLYVVEAHQATVKLKTRKESAARQIVHEEFIAGRYPRLAQDVKEQVVELLKDGLSPADALAEVQSG